MSLDHSLPARSRAQITLTGVCIARGGRTVLHDVDLALGPASRTAIVGENGRGKSTLLHIIAGSLAPDAGSVVRIGTVDVAEQEMPADGGRTVGDALTDAMADAAAALAEGADAAVDRYALALERTEALDAWDAERRLGVALDALGAVTDAARPLQELSVGQRYRVRLACLLGGTADLLLLDEPTNHLDRAGLDFLTERLRARTGGVVLVSHDRALLTDVADTFVDLDPTPDDRPSIHGGGYDGYRQGRRATRSAGSRSTGASRPNALSCRTTSAPHRIVSALDGAPTRARASTSAPRARPASCRACTAGATRSIRRR